MTSSEKKTEYVEESSEDMAKERFILNGSLIFAHSGSTSVH